MSTQEKYLNPFTDFGFKKLFGSDVNKDLLIHFLNSVLPKEATISDLKYLKTEYLGKAKMDRKVIYDLYCENEKGEKFIVELQKARQEFFKERTIFYSTFPLQEQAITGDWNFKLKAVYTVSILDFLIDDNSHSAKQQKIKEKEPVKINVKLVNTDTHEVFYDKLTYIYIQIPLFDKTEEELETYEDKWFYIIKNLQKFKNRPEKLQERIFDKVFQTAELAQFDKKERMAYEDSLKYYRDIKNVIDTAKKESLKEGEEKGLKEGVKKGKEEKAIDVAKKALLIGSTFEFIAEVTGLSIEQIQEIADSLNK